MDKRLKMNSASTKNMFSNKMASTNNDIFASPHMLSPL
jgi:hypothetical protein